MNTTTILTDEQVKTLAKKLKQSFGKDALALMKNYKVIFEDIVRLMSLKERCREARGELGLSIKEVAARLKTPQYRVKAVEDGSQKDMLPEVTEKYIKFLGIEDWFEQWINANVKLAKKLGISEIRYGKTTQKG